MDKLEIKKLTKSEIKELAQQYINTYEPEQIDTIIGNYLEGIQDVKRILTNHRDSQRPVKGRRWYESSNPNLGQTAGSINNLKLAVAKLLRDLEDDEELQFLSELFQRIPPMPKGAKEKFNFLRDFFKKSHDELDKEQEEMLGLIKTWFAKYSSKAETKNKCRFRLVKNIDFMASVSIDDLEYSIVIVDKNNGNIIEKDHPNKGSNKKVQVVVIVHPWNFKPQRYKRCKDVLDLCIKYVPQLENINKENKEEEQQAVATVPVADDKVLQGVPQEVLQGATNDNDAENDAKNDEIAPVQEADKRQEEPIVLAPLEQPQIENNKQEEKKEEFKEPAKSVQLHGLHEEIKESPEKQENFDAWLLLGGQQRFNNLVNNLALSDEEKKEWQAYYKHLVEKNASWGSIWDYMPSVWDYVPWPFQASANASTDTASPATPPITRDKLLGKVDAAIKEAIEKENDVLAAQEQDKDDSLLEKAEIDIKGVEVALAVEEANTVLIAESSVDVNKTGIESDDNRQNKTIETQQVEDEKKDIVAPKLELDENVAARYNTLIEKNRKEIERLNRLIKLQTKCSNAKQKKQKKLSFKDLTQDKFDQLLKDLEVATEDQQSWQDEYTTQCNDSRIGNFFYGIRYLFRKMHLAVANVNDILQKRITKLCNAYNIANSDSSVKDLQGLLTAKEAHLNALVESSKGDVSVAIARIEDFEKSARAEEKQSIEASRTNTAVPRRSGKIRKFLNACRRRIKLRRPRLPKLRPFKNKERELIVAKVSSNEETAPGLKERTTGNDHEYTTQLSKGQAASTPQMTGGSNKGNDDNITTHTHENH